MTSARSRFAPVWFLLLFAVNAMAYAQSAIIGVVKDSSGAVLPGVTVEAASDVLIEKVKSAMTDGGGGYRIADLRPGVYVVTFTHARVQHLQAGGLRPGGGVHRHDQRRRWRSARSKRRSPSPARRRSWTSRPPPQTAALDREAIDVIPTGRSIQGMAQLVVGINLSLPDTGGARAMQQTYMTTHGMAAANTTVLVDGMMVNGLQADGAVQSYFNDAMNQEVSYQTSGIGAETSAGGVRLNMIPREGGNRFSGDFKMASAARAPGSRTTSPSGTSTAASTPATPPTASSTTPFALGGPIMKDKLWFFTSARYFSVNNFIANTFFDDGSQGVDDQYIKSAMARLTWQVSPRNKISGVLRRDRQVSRPRHAEQLRSGDGGVQWFSPAYHTTASNGRRR